MVASINDLDRRAIQIKRRLKCLGRKERLLLKRLSKLTKEVKAKQKTLN